MLFGQELTRAHSGTESNIIVVLYQPGSSYDNYVTAQIAAGREVTGDANGIPFGDPAATNAPAAPSDETADDASSSAVNPPGTQGLICGQYCSSNDLCTGDDGCKCIADPWQGVGSGYFTGTCKLPYFSGGSGRELGEVNNDSDIFVNSTGAFGVFDDSTAPLSQQSNPKNLTLTDIQLACPCNCTYVSKACCSSTSGLVYEALSLRLGALMPPNGTANATATCDVATGKFQMSR